MDTDFWEPQGVLIAVGGWCVHAASMSHHAQAVQVALNKLTMPVLTRIMQMADNAGTTDEHRALNYLAVRYPVLYAATADAFGWNASLAAVEVRPSRLSGVRGIVDVIFSFTHRQTDVTEKYFVRVNVTEEFPFLVTRLTTYYDR
jgi:PatG C-terminal